MIAPLPVTADEVRAAAGRLFPHLLPTPLLPSHWLSERAGRAVLIKWESQQRTGSFKWRGALYKLLCLRDRGVDRVLAVSAGNHGLALAEAGALVGVNVTVVVPASAAKTKVAAIRRAGAELIVGGPDYDTAEARARELAAERDLEFVSPYNDAEVIAGQGTVALEMLGQGRFGTLVVPAGGGGLIAGAAVVAADHDRAPRVVGAQPAHAPALHEALARGGVIAPVHEEPTLADGLAGNLEAGSITVPITVAHVQHIALCSEASIRQAITGFVTHEHQIVEGSGAVGAAAILDDKLPAAALGEGPIALIVTGRNLDVERLREILR